MTLSKGGRGEATPAIKKASIRNAAIMPPVYLHFSSNGTLTSHSTRRHGRGVSGPMVADRYHRPHQGFKAEPDLKLTRFSSDDAPDDGDRDVTSLAKT